MTDQPVEPKDIDIAYVLKALPHRYPFLLIDKVLDYQLGKSLTALKNVTVNEPFFQGHFPGNPVMPGVMILESLAQACGVLAYLGMTEHSDNPLYYLVKIDKARFSQTVRPGDQLIQKVEQKRMLRGMGLYDCTAEVNGEAVATAQLLCAERSAKS